jgi:hypothetical protein
MNDWMLIYFSFSHKAFNPCFGLPSRVAAGVLPV